jgi:hypothetical protein
MDFETFWKRFVTVERRSGAVAARFAGVQLYPLLRTRIFYAVTQELGLFDAPHPNFAKTELDESMAAIETIDGLAPAQAVVVPFRRRVAGAEPYSDRIREQLAAQGKSVRVLDFIDPENLADLDLERLRALFATQYTDKVNEFLRYASRGPAEERWNKIIDAFKTEFGIELEKFQKYPKYLVRRTLIDQHGFGQLFKNLGTKELYLVNAYSEPGLVVAAKRTGVKVFEIQHGFISPFHPAYSYPAAPALGGLLKRRQKVDSAADVLLTWGPYWGKDTTLPAGASTQVSGPTAPFDQYRQAVLAQDRIVPKQVLFTSQGAVGQELFQAAVATARALADHTVIYRLHPNESLDDYAELSARQAAADASPLPKNFSISHRDPIFLDLVSRSEYLIGAFSTTLFEGLALGCKVLVLPLQGYQNVQAAIDSGDLTLISSLKELHQTLLSASKAKDPYRYYSEIRG